ncbi:hypothetical protein BH688_12590 [Kushneria phosphatilytica]|nr:hypothetical protein BH688_12590 [Kushneria phosphatilytica]
MQFLLKNIFKYINTLKQKNGIADNFPTRPTSTGADRHLIMRAAAVVALGWYPHRYAPTAGLISQRPYQPLFICQDSMHAP